MSGNKNMANTDLRKSLEACCRYYYITRHINPQRCIACGKPFE